MVCLTSFILSRIFCRYSFLMSSGAFGLKLRTRSNRSSISFVFCIYSCFSRLSTSTRFISLSNSFSGSGQVFLSVYIIYMVPSMIRFIRVFIYWSHFVIVRVLHDYFLAFRVQEGQQKLYTRPSRIYFFASFGSISVSLPHREQFMKTCTNTRPSEENIINTKNFLFYLYRIFIELISFESRHPLLLLSSTQSTGNLSSE